MKRLLRKSAEDSFESTNTDNFNEPYSAGDSFSNMYSSPMGLLFRDSETLIDNDEIQKKQYGPSKHIPWDFEQPVDNPEWSLQSTFTEKL